MTNRDLAVSYKSKRGDFPEKWKDFDFENHKLKLFQEQVKGWMIKVAEEIKQKQIGHADFAVLAVVLPYFENIAKFRFGYTSKGKSAYYFRKGLRLVFPKFKKGRKSTLHKLLYDQTRSGLYHVGLTGSKVELNCSMPSAILFKNKGVIICPQKLIAEIQIHFCRYCQALRDSKNKTLRANFEKRLKFVWGVKQ